MSNDYQSTIVKELLRDLKHSGGKMIAPANLTQTVMDQYLSLSQELINTMLNNIAGLPLFYKAQLKLHLFQSAADYYRKMIEARGSRNEVSKAVAEIIVSEKDFTDVESIPAFANYQMNHHSTYLELEAIISELKKSFNPLTGIRAIPSYTTLHIRNAIDAAKVQLRAASVDKDAVNNENSLFSQLTSEQQKNGLLLLERISASMNEPLVNIGAPMDMIQVLQFLKDSAISEGERVSLDPAISFQFANSSYSILPGMSEQNEDNSFSDLQNVDGLGAVMFDVENGWVEFASIEDKKLITPKTKGMTESDLSELQVLPTLTNMFLGLVLAWENGRIGANHVTMPLNCFPVFPMLRVIFSHSYQEEENSLDLEFFKKMVFLAGQSISTKGTPYAVYTQMLSDALAQDMVMVSTRARELLDSQAFGSLEKAISRHLAKAGTKASQYVSVDDNLRATLPGNYMDNHTDTLEFRLDRPVWTYGNVPTRTPRFSSEAMLLKRQRSPLCPFSDAVSGKEVTDLLTELYNWQGNDSESHTFRISLDHIEDGLLTDASQFDNKKVTGNSARDVITRAVYDYAKYGSPQELTLSTLCQRYGAAQPQGHIDLWKETSGFDDLVAVGYDTVVCHRAATLVRMRTSSITFGKYEGNFVPETEKTKTAVVLDLAQRLYRAYFFEPLPTKVTNVAYVRSFENVAYHKRVVGFSEKFAPLELNTGAFRLMNHRMAMPYLGNDIDPRVIEGILKGEASVSKLVWDDIRSYAKKLVGTLSLNFRANSDAMRGFISFINGTLTIDEQNMLKKPEVVAFFDMIISNVFGPVKGKHTMLILAYVSAVITEIEDLGETNDDGADNRANKKKGSK